MSAAADSRGSAQRRRQRAPRLLALADSWLANGRLAALLLVVICGIMLWAFIFSGDFRVERLTIQGLQYGQASDVAARAVLMDEPIFELEAEAIAGRVAALPNVEQVSVEVRFPNTATIQIVERKPSINVRGSSGENIVSADAHLIAPGVVNGLPTLQIDNVGDADANELSADLVAATVAVAGAYGPGATLIWNSEFGLVMEQPGGRLIIFGEPTEIGAKLTVLSAIVVQLDADWSQIDLRVPTRPNFQ